MVTKDLKSRDNGFTLVEMLIVVILLGIVATIAVLSLSSVNENSQVSACRTDYQAVNAAIAAYRNDFSGDLSLADNPEYAAGSQPTSQQKLNLYSATSNLKGLGYMAVLTGGAPDGLYQIALESDPDTNNTAKYRAKVMKVVNGSATDVTPLAATPSADDCSKIKS